MADEQSTGKTFFHTLPGIITAIAGLITAIAGLILILNQSGCFKSKAEKTEQPVNIDKVIDSDNDEEAKPVKKSSLNKGNVLCTPDSIKHTTRQLILRITEANAEILPDDEVVLTLKLKCINNSDYEYHFYANYLGAKVGDDNYSPDRYSPSGNYQSIPPRSFKNLEYNFRLPRFTKNFNLDFYDLDKLVGSSAFALK